MTVAELIKLLKAVPEDTLVALDDFEQGVDFECELALRESEEGIIITFE